MTKIFIKLIFSLFIICMMLFINCPANEEVNKDNGTTWSNKLFGVANNSTMTMATAADPAGNIYVTGYTTGNLDGQTVTGHQDILVIKYDPSGNKIWTKLIGASESYSYSNGISISPDGVIFITGYTNGNIGMQTLTGTFDAFVIKINADGGIIWTKLFGTKTCFTYAFGITINANDSNNIYVTGGTNGNLNGETATGTEDAFLVKLGSDTGAVTWTKLYGSIGRATRAQGICNDMKSGQNNVYITGYTTGPLLGETLNGTYDCFVINIQTNGTLSWTKLIGHTTGVLGDVTQGFGICPDYDNTDGYVYVTGYTSSSTLNGESGDGTRNMFIVKYIKRGDAQWTRLLGAVHTFSNAICVSYTDHSVYSVGYTTGGLDGQTITGNEDMCIVKYSNSGNKQWTRLLGIAGSSTRAQGIACKSGLFVAGYTEGNLDGMTKKGTIDGFLVKYDESGVKQ